MITLAQMASENDDTLHLVVGAGCLVLVILIALVIVYK